MNDWNSSPLTLEANQLRAQQDAASRTRILEDRSKPRLTRRELNQNGEIVRKACNVFLVNRGLPVGIEARNLKLGFERSGSLKPPSIEHPASSIES